MLKELAKATTFQTKIRITEPSFRIVKNLRARRDFPPAAPRTMFISADCLFGDSVLLRPHIANVARTFPGCEVLVSARTPVLLTGLPDNVTVLPTAQASQRARQMLSDIGAAFIPYFYDGDCTLWRKHLSSIGSTFNCDVGFAGRRDYIYARRQVFKNLELHEHENLAHLFRLWPLINFSHIPGPDVPPEAENWRLHSLNNHGITGEYCVVQFGAGYASKEWPLDCWIPFLRDFGATSGLPVVIIGASNWAEAGEIAVRELRNEVNCFNLIGKTTTEQIMALVRSAALVIGGCSGPKHLAIDYKVPTFTLYSATEPYRWGASRDHELHAYITALPQKLTAMELHGLRDDHRPRLLKPELVTEKALHHLAQVRRRG